MEEHNRRKIKNKYALTVIIIYDEYSVPLNKNSYSHRLKHHHVANDTIEDKHKYEHDLGDDDYINGNDYVNNVVVGNYYIRELKDIRSFGTGFLYKNLSKP